MPVNNPNNQPLLVGYGQSQGLINIFPYPIISNRDPGVNDRKAIGVVWVNKLTNAAWVLTSISNAQANWLAVGGGGGAGVFTDLTVTPGPIDLEGNITINDDASATTTSIGTGSTGAMTLGNFANGGTTVRGNSMEIDVDPNGLLAIGNNSSTASIRIGTSNTGEVRIGNGTGNTRIAAGNLTITSGSLFVGTDVTVNSGPVTITDGDLVIGANGKLRIIPNDFNSSVGTSTALAAGTVTVATGGVESASNIFVSHATAAGTLGQLSVANIVAGTSFDIISDNVADTSTVNWLIIN